MKKRILSTFVLWAGVLALLWFFRTTGAVIALTLVSVLTLREFYLLMESSGFAPFSGLGMLFGGLVTLSPWTEQRLGVAAHPLIPLAAVVFSVRMILERPPEKRVESLASTLFGLAFVALLLGYLVRIVTPVKGDAILPDGRIVLCLWVVAVTKFCDVGALLTGLAIGRHKMAPLSSPKKTWEGAAGGVATSAGIGALVAWLGRSVLPIAMTPGKAALIALPLGVIGIVSDLVESIIKRRAAIKDSGVGIPGIGGIFDLSDSLILTAPLAYLLLGLP